VVTNQPFQDGDVDEPKGVRLTDYLPGDREAAAAAVDFDRRRVVAPVGPLERADVLAAEERLDDWQIGASEGE